MSAVLSMFFFIYPQP